MSLDVVTKAVLTESLKGVHDQMKAFIEKADGEIAASKTLSSETKAALETLSEKATALVDRIVALEQKGLTMPAGAEAAKSLGEQFAAQEGFQKWQNSRSGTMRMEVKAAITNQNPLTVNQPLVVVSRQPGILHEPTQPLTIRDLLPTGQTNSNMIEFARELVFTNNAGPQFAAANGGTRENVTKPESGITFELAQSPVITLAHWIPVSKQVLADSPALLSYINTRLIYGLKLVEEQNILNGTGANGQLKGILHADNHTEYNRAETGDTRIDTIRRAFTQVTLSNYTADSVVLHPADWEAIELQKDAEERYLWANPALQGQPQLWGRRVVQSMAIAEGTFLTGSFALGAQIWDRQEAAIQVSYENQDNFVKNMATVLAEERLALAVYRPKAFVAGQFEEPVTSP